MFDTNSTDEVRVAYSQYVKEITAENGEAGLPPMEYLPWLERSYWLHCEKIRNLLDARDAVPDWRKNNGLTTPK